MHQNRKEIEPAYASKPVFSNYAQVNVYPKGDSFQQNPQSVMPTAGFAVFMRITYSFFRFWKKFFQIFQISPKSEVEEIVFIC